MNVLDRDEGDFYKKNTNASAFLSISAKVRETGHYIGQQRSRAASRRNPKSESFSMRCTVPAISCPSRLVILDYLTSNKDRSLDNFRIKYCNINHEKASLTSLLQTPYTRPTSSVSPLVMGLSFTVQLSGPEPRTSSPSFLGEAGQRVLNAPAKSLSTGTIRVGSRHQVPFSNVLPHGRLKISEQRWGIQRGFRL